MSFPGEWVTGGAASSAGDAESAYKIARQDLQDATKALKRASGDLRKATKATNRLAGALKGHYCVESNLSIEKDYVKWEDMAEDFQHLIQKLAVDGRLAARSVLAEASQLFPNEPISWPAKVLEFFHEKIKWMEKENWTTQSTDSSNCGIEVKEFFENTTLSIRDRFRMRRRESVAPRIQELYDYQAVGMEMCILMVKVQQVPEETIRFIQQHPNIPFYALIEQTLFFIADMIDGLTLLKMAAFTALGSLPEDQEDFELNYIPYDDGYAFSKLKKVSTGEYGPIGIENGVIPTIVFGTLATGLLEGFRRMKETESEDSLSESEQSVLDDLMDDMSV